MHCTLISIFDSVFNCTLCIRVITPSPPGDPSFQPLVKFFVPSVLQPSAPDAADLREPSCPPLSQVLGLRGTPGRGTPGRGTPGRGPARRRGSQGSSGSRCGTPRSRGTPGTPLRPSAPPLSTPDTPSSAPSSSTPGSKRPQCRRVSLDSVAAQPISPRFGAFLELMHTEENYVAILDTILQVIIPSLRCSVPAIACQACGVFSS